MSNLKRQIELAKKNIREQKKCMPYLFIEWQNMERARLKLKVAKRKYKEAKKLWEKLGE